jgi:hypothetical protein
MQVRTNHQPEWKSDYLQKRLSRSTKILDWARFAAIQQQQSIVINSDPTSRGDSETLQGYYREPCAVYVAANESEKCFLKKLTDCNFGSWKNWHSIIEGTNPTLCLPLRFGSYAFKFVGENYKTISPTTEWENLMKNGCDLCLWVTRRMIQSSLACQRTTKQRVNPQSVIKL